MTLASRLAKIEKALARKTLGITSQVPDEDLKKVIADKARNFAKWMPLETARHIVATTPRNTDFDEWTDAQLEAYIVVLDSKI